MASTTNYYIPQRLNPNPNIPTPRHDKNGFLGMNWGNPFSEDNMSPMGFGMSALGSSLGQMGGSLIGGGLQSGAGNVLNGLSGIASAIPGPWGAAAGAALGVAAGVTNKLFGSKLNDANIAAVEGGIARANSAVASASDFDTLASTMGSTADISGFSNSFIGKDGTFSNKAANKAKQLRAEVNNANARQALTMTTNAENIANTNMNNLEANYAAFGGPMDFGGAIGYDLMNQYLGMKRLSAIGQNNSLPSMPNSFNSDETNVKAKGGPLFTHGAIFDNGLTFINNGGTHEQNPNEGVQIGVDPQGIPNLVEEGEVIFNDYVFSNRIRVPKSIRNKYKLRGSKSLTFAEAAKYLSRESEERPNDPISKRGLEALLSGLANAQEELKAKREVARDNNKFGTGGSPNRLNPYSNFIQLGKDTDFYTPEYMGFWNYMGDSKNKDNALKWLERINSGEFGDIGGNTFTLDDIQRLSHDYKQGPVHNAYKKASEEFYTRKDPFEKGITINPENPLGINIPNASSDNLKLDTSLLSNVTNTPSNIEVPPTLPTWPRYVPAFASGVMALTDALGLTNKPDYTEATMALEAAKNASSYSPVEFSPIGNYLSYTPFDREFYINQLNAQSGATRRAVLQNAGLNRGMGMAAILAADNNAQNQLGQMARQAEEYNFAQRQQIEGFNRGTNQFNSEGALKADMANQEASMKSRDAYLRGTLASAGLRQRERQQSNAARSLNMTNFIDSLGDIGRENFQMNMINHNPALYYYLSGRGVTKYKGAKGGYLTRKKR